MRVDSRLLRTSVRQRSEPGSRVELLFILPLVSASWAVCVPSSWPSLPPRSRFPTESGRRINSPRTSVDSRASSPAHWRPLVVDRIQYPPSGWRWEGWLLCAWGRPHLLPPWFSGASRDFFFHTGGQKGPPKILWYRNKNHNWIPEILLYSCILDRWDDHSP